jgi:hypothetical protein
MRIFLLLFGMGPKRVSHTETRTDPMVLENRVVREYLDIRREKKRKSWVKTQQREMSRFVFVSRFISVFISRRIRWEGRFHARERTGIHGRFGWERLKE